MRDSRIATNKGPGKVTEKDLQVLAKKWGQLPEKINNHRAAGRWSWINLHRADRSNHRVVSRGYLNGGADTC